MMLVNDYANAQLGNDGPTVQAVEVTLLYLPKLVADPLADHFDLAFRRVVRLSPSV